MSVETRHSAVVLLLRLNPVSVFPDEDGEDGAGPTGDYDEEDDEEEDEDGSEGGEVGLSFQGKQGDQVGNSGFSRLRHRPASVSHNAPVLGQAENRLMCLRTN